MATTGPAIRWLMMSAKMNERLVNIRHLRPLPRNEEGQSIVIVALFLFFVFLAFAALAVDGTIIYMHRRNLQNIADVATLAAGLDHCEHRDGQPPGECDDGGSPLHPQRRRLVCGARDKGDDDFDKDNGNEGNRRMIESPRE